ncbi:MAG: hypothetical protein EOO93_02680 [Pedobacter sp.]|nr:MAG: hypothetical protein EOO93_02680 [Pedobacter sp.]
MIALDYVKLYLKNIDIPRLTRLPELDFKTSVSISTGLYSNNIEAEYYHCTIKIIASRAGTSSYVEFSGSIHKMWNAIQGIKAPYYRGNRNDKGFNGNIFTLNDFNNARIHLEYLFACKADQMIFQGVEFGVNINTPFAVNSYLQGLLYHRNIEFEFNYNKNYYVAKHNYFTLKLYNKSAQYKIDDKNIFRAEIKILKTEEIKLKKVGMVTLGDINELTLKKALDMLIMRFDEVVYYDYTINPEQLKDKDKLYLNHYSNPRYWIYEVKPHHRDRPKKHLKTIIENHSENLSGQIRQLMIKCAPTHNV